MFKCFLFYLMNIYYRKNIFYLFYFLLLSLCLFNRTVVNNENIHFKKDFVFCI